jgi:ankyrin repeat protein
MWLQFGWTALMWASSYGQSDVVHQLLAIPGILVNVADQVIALKELWPSPC